jgi:uncharacterized protein Usg
MFAGYGLTTAHILYRLPDYQNILQEFVWQEFDFHPEYPHLRKFIIFWHKKLEGPIFKVEVAHSDLGGNRIELAKDVWKLQ